MENHPQSLLETLQMEKPWCLKTIELKSTILREKYAELPDKIYNLEPILFLMSVI